LHISETRNRASIFILHDFQPRADTDQETAEPQIESCRRIEVLALVRLKLFEERLDIPGQLRTANITRNTGREQTRRPNQLPRFGTLEPAILRSSNSSLSS
jgi:hypothetical protein